ncbi:MAG: histidine kinase dimerization/phospho-acceptor domain-containing protein, partial [Sciscionella sp.]
MTGVAVVAVSVGAVLLGFVLGALIGRRFQRRPMKRATGLTVAELISRVLDSSHNGVVVLNEWGDVVLHNVRAEELGVVVDNRVDGRARDASQQVRELGEAVWVDLSPPTSKGRQPAAVRGEVRPLAEDFTVLDAADESEAVRLEATRRDFVANVSHELKTPVGALALLAEAVIDAADDADEVRRFSGS